MIIHVNCGLGNQMFQYAFGQAIGMSTGINVSYDLSWFEKKNIAETGTPRKYELNVFETNIIEPKLFYLLKYDLYDSSFIHRLYKKALRSTGIVNLLYEQNEFMIDYSLINRINKKSYIVGYFQTEDYFIKYENSIRNMFRFRYELSENSKKYYNDILKSNSVGIHIRRGDFLKYKSFGTCSNEYYINAIKYILSKIDAPKFFIFSDDLNWVKEQSFFNNLNISYVEGNIEDKSYEDMRLMSLCRHNIISNSSFSWWGSWLNNNQNKIVIAPKRWFADDNMNAKVKRLIPSSWIKL